MGTGLEVLLILVLILANGALAMAEIAIVSARRARLEQLANTGDENARAALALAEDPGDFLSTIQVGITLVGVLAGAFGGATLAEPLAAWIAQSPALAPYSNGLAFGLVVVAITYLSLIIGELVPKRLALSDPERVAASVAGPMGVLSRIGAPVVRLLTFSTEAVLRLLGVRPSDQPPVTEEEVKILIRQGTRAGVFAEAEQDMLAGVLRLGDRRAGSLMTPRTDVIWLDLDDSPEVHRQMIISSAHSRFPVARGSLDHIEGVVLAKDLLASNLDGQPLNLAAHMEKPFFIPESMPALKVLELVKASRLQMVLVIDEFGGMQGMVTSNDILEAIVGDFPLPDDLGEAEAVQREDGSWLLDGMMPVDEFLEMFRVNQQAVGWQGFYQTVGGLVMENLGRIPETGDRFEWNGLRFEVVDMDGMRVDKVIVLPTPQPAEPEDKG